MNFGLKDIKNNTIFGIPNEELEQYIGILLCNLD